MNSLKSVITIITLTSATLAFGQKDVENNYFVTPVKGEMNVDGHQVFYSLPSNSLMVSLKIEKTVTAKGPYAQYAEKYLNITTGVVDESATAYSIENVKVERISQPDTSQLYAINFTGLDNLPMVQLNDNGTILACNCPRVVEGYKAPKPQSNVEPETKPIAFLDMGVKPFIVIEDEEDEADEDSVEVKKPKQQQPIVMTEEENAAAAAAFIRKIRKRRLKLVAGMAEETNPVDGKAMKLMIQELDRLEAEYLNLFVGKSTKQTYTQTVIVTPNNNSEDEQITFGYFSKQYGFGTAKRGDAYPITMKINSLTNAPKVSIKETDTSGKSSSSIKYGLYYRTPGMVSVSIDCDGLLHHTSQWTIAQKGVVVPMPSDYLANHKYSIEFDAETGALKRISGN